MDEIADEVAERAKAFAGCVILFVLYAIWCWIVNATVEAICGE